MNQDEMEETRLGRKRTHEERRLAMLEQGSPQQQRKANTSSSDEADDSDYDQSESDAESSKRRKSDVVVTAPVEQERVRSDFILIGAHKASIDLQCTTSPILGALADRVVVSALSEHDNPLVSLNVSKSAVHVLCNYIS